MVDIPAVEDAGVGKPAVAEDGIFTVALQVVPEVGLYDIVRVVPVRGASGEITAVLDIDSAELSTFDEVDARWLEEIAGCL